jgi:uncharacterized protein YbjT (DUF2867 family)
VILLAGGTGRLGRRLVGLLRARGEAVRVLTRDPVRAEPLGPGVEVVLGDVRDRRTLDEAVDGVDTVVSAMHGFVGRGGGSPASVDRDGNASLTTAAGQAGADLVLLSVVHAAPDSPMELFRMKFAAEQHLRDTEIPATIVRAGAFIELWAEILEATAARSGRPVVFGRGGNPVNVVCVRDVAAVVDRVIADPASRGTTVQVGGPNVTMNELAAAVQAAAHRLDEPRHVPRLALRAAASTIGVLRPTIGRQVRAALAMDTVELTFDAASHRPYTDLPETSVATCLAEHCSVNRPA